MRVLVRLHGRPIMDSRGNSQFRDVRGPDGSAYQAFKEGLGKRYRERMGHGESKEDKRRLRNARKAERRGR